VAKAVRAPKPKVPKGASSRVEVCGSSQLSPAALVYAFVSKILTHSIGRGRTTSITDGQLVKWYDEGWHFGRLLSANAVTASVLIFRGYPPQPHILTLYLSELEAF
jgi:hypothetical protein